MTGSLHAEMVDPRYVTVEVNSPAYRVDFWTFTRPELTGWERGLATAEWRVTGAADVRDVIAWAEEHREGRDYVLSVELRLGESDVALARLSGGMPE